VYKERFFTDARVFSVFPAYASRTLTCDSHEYIRSGALLSNQNIRILGLLNERIMTGNEPDSGEITE
jgi:hypothetical protein